MVNKGSVKNMPGCFPLGCEGEKCLADSESSIGVKNKEVGRGA